MDTKYNRCQIIIRDDIFDGTRSTNKWSAYCKLNSMETTYDSILKYVDSCDELQLSISTQNLSMCEFDELNSLIKKNTNLTCIDLGCNYYIYNVTIPINCKTVTLPYHPEPSVVFTVPGHVEEIVMNDIDTEYRLEAPDNLKWISFYPDVYSCWRCYHEHSDNKRIFDFRDLVFLQGITIRNIKILEYMEFKLPYGCSIVVDDDYEWKADDSEYCDWDDSEANFLCIKENFIH